MTRTANADAAAPSTDPSARSPVLSRVLPAPRELVFEAWTQARHFARWFNPTGATMPTCLIDARVGGTLRFCHVAPDGMTVRVQGTFREVVVPERLVFTLGFVDRDGRPAAHPMFPDWPLEALSVVTVTLREHADGTELTVQEEITPASAAAHASVVREQGLAQEGWQQTADGLPAYLRAMEPDGTPAGTGYELVLTRTLDAPRERVFRMWTEAEHLAQWFGPHHYTVPDCEVDLRPGGALRLVMRAPDGAEHAMTAVFHEIEPPRRLTYSSAAQDPEGRDVLKVHTTLILDEDGDGTRMILRQRVLAVSGVGEQYLAGMEPGWEQTLEKLTEVLAGTR